MHQNVTLENALWKYNRMAFNWPFDSLKVYISEFLLPILLNFESLSFSGGSSWLMSVIMQGVFELLKEENNLNCRSTVIRSQIDKYEYVTDEINIFIVHRKLENIRCFLLSVKVYMPAWKLVRYKNVLSISHWIAKINLRCTVYYRCHSMNVQLIDISNIAKYIAFTLAQELYTCKHFYRSTFVASRSHLLIILVLLDIM